MYISVHTRLKKVLALLAIFAMVGTSVPVGALTAFAQEITEEATEEAGNTDTEVTDPASSEETEEVTISAPTEAPLDEATDSAPITEEATNTNFVVDANGIATIDTVALGVTYTAPQNSQVQVTFTQLPEVPGSLSIQEVLLTDEQVEQLGALSNVAYDITSNMANGTFSYDLKLPLPEGVADEAQVVFAETAADLAAGAVEAVATDKIEVASEDQTVAVSALDHFTIFVVTSFEEPQATPPSSGYNDTWTAYGLGATVTQVPSGTDGINSSEGDNHAVIKTSAYTDWDGRKSEFPEGGYDTRVDVYVDMSLATGGLIAKRMAFSSAINDPSGDLRRDFVFHLGTRPLSAGKWVVSASNNLIDLPNNPFNSPVTLTQTGWYTLEHQFRDVGGTLEVTLNIYKKGESSPVGSWTLSHGSDVIGSTVGGNRYGWFIDTGILNRFSKIAIDNTEIEYATASAVPTRPALTGEVIYDAIPSVLPSNFPSQGYQATQTFELGDKITFESGTGRSLLDGAVTLSSWACESGQWNLGTCETTPGATFTHPITLNIYGVAEDGTVGTLIASKTQTFEIPYRPSANVTCADQTQWKDTNGNCFNGYNHVVVFDLTGITVPDTVVYGITYNTQTYGAVPEGADGPYNSLNVSLNTDGAAPYIGTDVNTDEVFWDTSYPGYTRGFKADSGWSPYKVAVTFTAEPLAPPAIPTGLEYDNNPTIACGGSTNINYAYPAWNAVDGAVSYDYQALFNGSVVFSTNFTTNAHPGGTFGGGQNGVWGFQVRSVDAQGEKSDWSPVCEITLDTVAPATPVHISPADNSTLYVNDFYFDWTDVADVVEYEFQAAQDPTVDGNGALTNGVWNNKVSGAPDRDFLASSTIHSYGANGTWYWQVRAIDAAGNKSPWTTPWKMTIDLDGPDPDVAPQVSIVDPSPEEGMYVRGLITGHATATDDLGMGSYYLRFWKDAFEIAGGGTLVQGCQMAPGGDLLGTAVDATCDYDTRLNPDGPYVFSAQFQDSGINWGQALRTFTVDNTAPTITIKSESVGNGVDRFSNVSFKLYDLYKIDKLTLNGVPKDLTNNQWSDLNGVHPGDEFGGVEGENTLVVYDVAGNETTLVFTLDTTAPTAPTGLAWTDSENSNVPDNGTTALYAGTASWNANSEGDFSHYIYKYWNEIDTSAYDDVLTPWTATFYGAGNTHAGGVFNQGEGVHHFCIVAVDTTGNESACSAPFTITYAIPEEGGGDDGDEDADLTPITMCKFVNETPQAGWGMTLSNGGEEPTVYSTTTSETGCVTISVDLAYGPWTVVEEDRAGYTQIAAMASNGDEVSVEESDTEMCEFKIPGKQEFNLFSIVDLDEDPDYSCSFFNAQDVVDNSDDEDEPESSSFSSGTRVGSRSASRPQGQVLGASTSALEEGDFCVEPYLVANLGLGRENDSAQVVRLQKFLNEHLGASLAVTGVFETTTESAVKDFQLQYAADVLAPWGITAPTGFVYLTTKKKINELVCDKAFPLTPEELEEINRVKNQVLGVGPLSTPAKPEETVAGAATTSNEQVGAASGEDAAPADAAAEDKQDEEKGFFGRLWDKIFGN